MTRIYDQNYFVISMSSDKPLYQCISVISVDYSQEAACQIGSGQQFHYKMHTALFTHSWKSTK